jgi:hypothetical protein
MATFRDGRVLGARRDRRRNEVSYDRGPCQSTRCRPCPPRPPAVRCENLGPFERLAGQILSLVILWCNRKI